MNKLLLALALLWAPAAHAQALMCPTRAPGDSTNACASTAFVGAASSASIPATSNVLKGSGSAGSALAATPGTDYLQPTALPSATTSQIYGGTAAAGAAAVESLGTHLSLTSNTVATDAVGTGILATRGDINTALPSETTCTPYGGSGAAGAASAMTLGSGLSCTSGTITTTGAASAATLTTDTNAPASSSTTTYTMAGIAAAVTPVHSGKILIVIAMQLNNGVGGDGCIFQIAYGTGAAPSINGAATGTIAGIPMTRLQAINSGGQYDISSITAVVTGLTLSTAYWVDLQLHATGGNTCTMTNFNVSIMEN